MASSSNSKLSPAFYSCINIQTILNSPSSRCFQWSPDGQGFFVTKSAVYVITPEPGINHDLYSLLPSALQGATLPSSNSDSSQNGTDATSQLTLNWFRTMIQYDMKSPDTMRWPDFSQEFCAVSLGSIDPSIWSITFSPSGVAPDAGCLIAILTANMDLSLWKATKNALKGEWVKPSNGPRKPTSEYSPLPMLMDLCSYAVLVLVSWFLCGALSCDIRRKLSDRLPLDSTLWDLLWRL
ncbi:hypothetical protein V5O48_009680 [Marasmius crinis-equi]|uniref:Transcription factor IIIC 90kDa subunit N-terminal domain-containing protein n=1 Tax=Marasmius crinis-equi TaxID=585013 RepID=A0ABR3FAI2_9AGAR